MNRLVRPVTGSEPAGMGLVIAVFTAVPPEVRVPGPWATDVGRKAFVDGAGVCWFVTAAEATVDRLVALGCPCNCAELTTFQEGAEISRIIHPVR